VKQQSLEKFAEEKIQGPYRLPEDWRWVRLGEVAEIFYGKGIPRNERKDNGRFWAYGSNGPIYKTDQYLVEPPALIIGRKGSIGAIHLIDERYWAIDTTYYLKLQDQVDIRYLYWYLKTVDFSKIAITTTKPGLNRDDLRAVQIPLPPLSEQKRIVAYLDRIQEKIKSVQALQMEIEDEIEKFTSSILYQAFCGRL
jgi:type I restriction enzyme S subunit